MQITRAFCCNNLENYDEGAEWARKAVNTRPDLFLHHTILAVARVGQGRPDEARIAIEEARRVKPDLSLSVMRRLLPHYHPEVLGCFIDDLAKAGLPD